MTESPEAVCARLADAAMEAALQALPADWDPGVFSDELEDACESVTTLAEREYLMGRMALARGEYQDADRHLSRAVRADVPTGDRPSDG
ncbi:MAG: hypothetical protein KC561_07910, partial [Myxococcales bacterium]|nr:hypothetical protein [Myxococcales bacterium]